MHTKSPYEGVVGTKTLAFRAEEEIVFTAHVIAASEADAWDACKQMLEHSVKDAAAQVKGFYGLELLSLDLRAGTQHFVAGAFTQLIVNHTKTLAPGQKTIFPYGGFVLCLHKRIPEEWGKIDFKTYVEVFRKPRAQLDLWIKKKCAEILKDPRYAASVKVLELYDLSQESLFRFGEEEQTERLAAFLKKSAPDFLHARLKLFYEHPKGGRIDLFEQFDLPQKT